MRIRPSLFFLAAVLAACSNDSTTAPDVTGGGRSLRIINAHASAVDVLMDGAVVNSGVPAGQVVTLQPTGGQHTLAIRKTGSTAEATVPFAIADGVTRTVAALRLANGSVSASVIDDTASVVPAGATKLRVLHLSPNTGELQVYRTQPDYNVAPVSWQFPFNYQTEVTGPGAPYYQSTVGTWEVHIWQSPASSDGWANAPIKLTIPLASGERKTVLILDKTGGGYTTQIID